VSVSQVAQVLVAGTDLLIVGRVLGPGTVVLYFCTAKLVMVLANQPQMLMEAAQPGLAQMRTGESRERLTQVCAALTQAMLVLSGIVVCVVLGVNRGFVTWWVGADRFGGLALTSALLGAMVRRHWHTTTVYALFAFGRERRIALTTLADGVVTVGAQIGLAYLIGPLGVAIGSIAGVLLVSLPVNLAGLGQETTGLAPILKSLVPWAWRLALATAVAAAFATTWQPSHVPGLVAATLALATVYAALVLPLLLRGTLATYVQPQLARLRAALFTAEAT
jgi:O-antigen/teichoic acid export membrane protein